MTVPPSKNTLETSSDVLTPAPSAKPDREGQSRHAPSSGAEDPDFHSFSGGGRSFVAKRHFEPLTVPHEINWRELEPRGFYARVGRHLLNYLILTLVLLPVLCIGIVIALANWIAQGDYKKVIFRQQRMGWKGVTFRIYKFRTMQDTPDDHFDSWKGGKEATRVNRFGQLLRKTHLDELPQILNILRGEMSFIGPRPEMVQIDAWARSKVTEWHQRLGVKPGITGQAQITHGYAGGKVEEYEHKLEADLLYIERLSLFRELHILLRTPTWMLKGRGGTANKPGEELTPQEPLRDVEVQPMAPAAEESEAPVSPAARVSSEG